MSASARSARGLVAKVRVRVMGPTRLHRCPTVETSGQYATGYQHTGSAQDGGCGQGLSGAMQAALVASTVALRGGDSENQSLSGK